MYGRTGKKKPKFSNFGGFYPFLDFGAHFKPHFFKFWAWGLSPTQSICWDRFN